MKNILYNKRAELTTRQIVLLVILVTSFAIILFFIFRLNLQQESVKEICHNSVVLRGNAALPTAKQTIPLNCRQAYVCVTQDGTCERMSSYDYRIVVKDKDEFYSAMAEELADCWWTYGEGKVDYVGKDALSRNNYCSLCSQLRFDDSIKEKIFPSGKVDKDDFYKNYLAKEKMPGKDITYAQYLFGTNDVGELVKINNPDTKQPVQGSFGELNLDKKDADGELYDYVVMMGIKSEISTFTWIAGGAVVGIVVGALIASGVGFVAGAIIIGVAGTAGAIGGYTYIATTVKGLSGRAYISPTIVAYNSPEYRSLNCAEIKTLS